MQAGLNVISKIVEWLIGFTVFSATSAVSLFVLLCVLENHFECLVMKRLTGILI